MEKKEKKVRQYRSRQGRSDKQYESNMKVMVYGCGTFIIAFVLFGVFKAITTIFL
jgi:hypothetical protein